jgi:5'-3' exoribonuclease 2
MKEIVKKLIEDKSAKKADKYVDKVQLGTDGWKLRYYKEKFHVDQGDLAEFIANIRRSYLEGLQWVYSYYYNGCVSWTWYYPYHYAPFTSDLINGAQLDIKFEMGEPATPFEQLMAVFPKQSAHAVPLCYRHLLSSPKSEIIDFYPTDFHIDINGARYEWMGVVLLPFIDRHRLVRAMKKADRNSEALTEHERELNRRGEVKVFFQAAEEVERQSGLEQAIS